MVVRFSAEFLVSAKRIKYSSIRQREQSLGRESVSWRVVASSCHRTSHYIARADQGMDGGKPQAQASLRRIYAYANGFRHPVGSERSGGAKPKRLMPELCRRETPVASLRPVSASSKLNTVVHSTSTLLSTLASRSRQAGPGGNRLASDYLWRSPWRPYLLSHHLRFPNHKPPLC